MNPAQQINHATYRLHAAIDTLLARVVATALEAAGAPTDAPMELRAKVTQIAVERMLKDLEAAHPGVTKAPA